MLHLKNNIKKIRKAYNETQPDFASRLGVTLPMQKTYELGKSNPDIVYLESLSKISGFTMEELKNEVLDFGSVTYRVTKVTQIDSNKNSLSGNATITLQEYIDELRTDKKEMQEVIRTNLTALTKMVNWLARHDQVYHETMLRSLARLEKRNESDLTSEAGTIEAGEMVEEMNKDSHHGTRR